MTDFLKVGSVNHDDTMTAFRCPNKIYGGCDLDYMSDDSLTSFRKFSMDAENGNLNTLTSKFVA